MKKFLLLALLSLTACAPKMGTVMPYEGGRYVSTGTAANAAEALEMANRTAGQCCTDQSRRHVVLNIENQYQGVISEDAGRLLDTAADLAALAGGWVPTLSSGDDYQTRLTFKCE